MFSEYNEDYFYFSNGGKENWWDNEIFLEEKFLEFKDKVYWYFDNELNVDKILVEFLCDDNGNDLEYNGVPLDKKVDLLICYQYKKGQNSSNTAVLVMDWLAKLGLISK